MAPENTAQNTKSSPFPQLTLVRNHSPDDEDVGSGAVEFLHDVVPPSLLPSGWDNYLSDVWDAYHINLALLYRNGPIIFEKASLQHIVARRALTLWTNILSEHHGQFYYQYDPAPMLYRIDRVTETGRLFGLLPIVEQWRHGERANFQTTEIFWSDDYVEGVQGRHPSRWHQGDRS